MSDISFDFEWWELVLISPLFGWPGIFIGAVIGALAWRKRPIAGGAIGAVAGNFIWFFLVVLFK